jgi:hypothetical protein
MGAYYVLKLNPATNIRKTSSKAVNSAKKFREFRKVRTTNGKTGGRWRR